MRKMTVGLVVGCSLVAVLAYLPTVHGQGDNGQSEVQRGFDIVAGMNLPLDLSRKNRSLVGQGSYYVNGISDCVGCHSGPNGYLSGGVNFGPATSRNLTPDAEGLPAGLTKAQFVEVMRFGTDFKPSVAPPGPTLIIMPWPAYRHGTDRYLDAIYEYLRSIPCLEGGPGQTPNRCS